MMFDTKTSAYFITHSLCTLAILTSLFSRVKTTPTGAERWRHPCGISNTDTSHLSPVPTRPLVEIITGMLVQIREGQEYSSNLQEKIAMERIQSMRNVAFLNGLHHDGFPSVKTATEEDIQNSLINVTKTHLENYRTLAITLVFIEKMRFDEEIYENKKYSNDILTMESKLYDVLCHMDEAISTKGDSIEHVTREVMQMELRTLSSRMDRFMRDYITVKDTSKILDHFIVQYSALNNQYQES
ncbi:unnamed protein product [Mytilus coruscus]|uniref:Uncharacterized protein n=1 Tax=Mytilus coruscus TaxID=42192 RepID=A0A6J8D1F8_MYTCO|nr:unnamed protein product [Mytilus coruscus]